ncbi:replication initiator protein A [Acidiphilium acidophilum]|uniref:replication initiator protein A n=1 Tax=Acidiphilium acidophilum TaxID=76588 RepID=UPI002E8E67CC|nr:replication initiator protein A [Acidiphilium acidophilum]
MEFYIPSFETPFCDQREMMERPFFSLAKKKRSNPIDYTSPDGKVTVFVAATPEYGMATIWDADILIYCASIINSMKKRRVNDIPQTLRVSPYDLLKSINRVASGRGYELLAAALDRLQSTSVKTSIRAGSRFETTFSWLDSWKTEIDPASGKSRGIAITLSKWFYDGVMMSGGLLSIDNGYFDIDGGRERWLYRVARKHAGGAGADGFAISMPTLFDKSGAEGVYRRFKFELLAITRRNSLPGYALDIEWTRREPLIRFTKRSALVDAIGCHEAPKQTPPNRIDVSTETMTAMRVRYPWLKIDDLHHQYMRSPPSSVVTHGHDVAFRLFIEQANAMSETAT